MFVWVCMQLRNHMDTQLISDERAIRYAHDIKWGMVQVCENEILLVKWSGGGNCAFGQLRTVEGTLL